MTPVTQYKTPSHSANRDVYTYPHFQLTDEHAASWSSSVTSRRAPGTNGDYSQPARDVITVLAARGYCYYVP